MISSWSEFVDDERELEYYSELKSRVDESYANNTVYPPKGKIYRSFELCKYENLKVVILGQDPYHTPNMADGLAFSAKVINKPPSLVNIFKEIESSTGKKSICSDGDLSPLAEQGVLLLNSTLTVNRGEANSHREFGWQIFSDHVIKYISDNKEKIIFLLWGSYAQSKRVLIDSSRHYILTSSHPSPLSAYRGFMGCNHFKMVNDILKNRGEKEILW